MDGAASNSLFLSKLCNHLSFDHLASSGHGCGEDAHNEQGEGPERKIEEDHADHDVGEEGPDTDQEKKQDQANALCDLEGQVCLVELVQFVGDSAEEVPSFSHLFCNKYLYNYRYATLNRRKKN